MELIWAVWPFLKFFTFRFIEVMIFCPNSWNFNSFWIHSHGIHELHRFIVMGFMAQSYPQSRHSWSFLIFSHGFMRIIMWAVWAVWTLEFPWTYEFPAVKYLHVYKIWTNLYLLHKMIKFWEVWLLVKSDFVFCDF